MKNILKNPHGEFTIRPYSSSDKENVLQLWEKAFLKKMPSELWDWKYLNKTFPSPKMVCGKENGELIVFYGGVSYFARNGTDKCSMVQLMDIMSHPDYRKTGLFIQTAEAYINMIEGGGKTIFLYGFPGEYHLKIGEKYLGYKALTKNVEYLRVEINRVCESPFSRTGKIEKIDKVDASFDHIWKTCEVYYPLSIIRDCNFLQWRFLEHPVHKYDVWIFKNQEDYPVGYAVFLEEGKNVLVVDILFPEDNVSVGAFFLQIGEFYLKRGFTCFEIWLPEFHFLSKALQEIGLKIFSEPKGFIPTIRPFKNTPSLSSISENLFYTMADGDLL